ncbi:MAG: HlyD family efflux transporter periplasmic adaptor subunit [Nitrospiraceae bacterium]|nr:MAG: HlyD family efflux transporter periplasmic adaptor subunit [Nitrospiraceae bacterium]
MKKKITVSLLIVLAAAVALYFSSYFKGEKIETIITTGIVEGTEVNFASKVPGRISEICCREGDAVPKGSVVVRIESEDIKASVEQAAASLERAKADLKSSGALVESSKAELNTAEADVRNASADVEKSRVQMEEAERQMERMTSLFRENLVSKSEEDRAVTEFGSLKAAYEASKARHGAALSRVELSASQLNYSRNQVESAKAGLKEAEAALSFQKAKLDDTVIITPISGTVAFRAMEPGEFVSPGMTIVTLMDMKNLWVRTDVEESLIGYVAIGSEADITIDSLPGKTIKGKVSEISRYAEFATQRDVRHGIQDIKTFRVKIGTGDTENILKPGMTVNVEIPVRQLTD